MKKIDYDEALSQILREDRRYDPEAYHFIREALDDTMRMMDKPREGAARHVSGQELLEGIRRFALDQFGPMALTVLHTWGVHGTEDFGHLVFNLVDKGVLGKTENDRPEDFANGYDFEDAFRAPFRPKIQERV